MPAPSGRSPFHGGRSEGPPAGSRSTRGDTSMSTSGVAGTSSNRFSMGTSNSHTSFSSAGGAHSWGAPPPIGRSFVGALDHPALSTSVDLSVSPSLSSSFVRSSTSSVRDYPDSASSHFGKYGSRWKQQQHQKMKHPSQRQHQQPHPKTPAMDNNPSKDLKTSLPENDNGVSSSMSDAHLRKLAMNALHSGTSPFTACFYAGILHTRSELPSDALLYAKGLFANDEGRRAVSLLERCHLLSHSVGIQEEEEDHHLDDSDLWGDDFSKMNSDPHGSEHENGHMDMRMPNDDIPSKPPPTSVIPLTMYIEASILAAKCLSSTGEWEEASNILEEACRYPPVESDRQNSTIPPFIIEDGDDPRLFRLARRVTPLNSPQTNGEIHPVSRLCCARGRAYDELSNPTRAAAFLKTALKIDPYCVESMDYLIERHLLTPQEEKELLFSLKLEEDSWLRDLYIARLTTTTFSTDTNPAAATTTTTNIHVNTTSASDLRNHFTVHSPAFPDASAIQHHHTPTSPHQIITATPNLGIITSTSSLYPATHNQQPHHRNLDPTQPPVQSDTTLISNAITRLRSVHKLSRNPELLANAAKQAYQSHNLPLAFSLAISSNHLDPLCTSCIYIHAATLLALQKKQHLFHLAHTLVQSNPRSAAGWFTVGCYYQLCQRYDIAQRHFCRATRLEPRRAEAWIAFGCSFASADESDQALAAYRAAGRLYCGSHYPLLYMGMEYLRTNHLSLAQHCLAGANTRRQEDPLVYNELGVCCYRKGEYEESVDFFLYSLKLLRLLELHMNTCFGEDGDCNTATTVNVTTTFVNRKGKSMKGLDVTGDEEEEDWVSYCKDPFWEPTVFNLGQSYRKIRRFQEAKHCFQKAISLCPGNAASYTALGYTKHLIGDIDGAIESYHQALSMKPDDTFSSEMLNRALKEAFVSPDPLLYPQAAETASKHDSNNYSFPSDNIHRGNNNLSLTSIQSLSFFKDTNANARNKTNGDESCLLFDNSDDVDMSMSST